MGRPLAELRLLLEPGELNLYRAIARVDGPWWGERDDLLAAAICQALAALGGNSVPLAKLIPVWDRAAAPRHLLPWDQAAQILTSRYVR